VFDKVAQRECDDSGIEDSVLASIIENPLDEAIADFEDLLRLTSVPSSTSVALHRFPSTESQLSPCITGRSDIDGKILAMEALFSPGAAHLAIVQVPAQTIKGFGVRLGLPVLV
jgi:hypothetical protein